MLTCSLHNFKAQLRSVVALNQITTNAECVPQDGESFSLSFQFLSLEFRSLGWGVLRTARCVGN